MLFSGFSEQIRAHDPATIVIFGASGDLTHRKLIPALFVAYMQDLLPEPFRIVGFARRDYDDEIFRDMMEDSIRNFTRLPAAEETIRRFVEHLYYHKGDLSSPDSYAALKDRLAGAAYPENHLFYLSIIPDLFHTTVHNLQKAGMIRDPEEEHWTRVVIEKPFGKDLESAIALNKELLEHLDETQIYRIDHYLGKETVQNILSFRFANAIFEPVFNRSYVDHIQITASETVGMEKGRGGYYDEYGALRDMVTNHLLQLLCLVTMEAPGDLSAESIRNEKVKLLNATKLDIREDITDAVCRGQYAEGVDSDGNKIKGYLQEDRIDPQSDTDSFAALRLSINNWRWAGVPILLRTGKRMARKTTEIAVQFKVPPLQLFQQVECEDDVCDITRIKPNTLIFRIQPDEGIFLKVGTKRPGMRFVVEDVDMDFSYSGKWNQSLPEAYERLLLDTLHGDSTLFTRSDEVAAEWRVVQPILDNLELLKPFAYPPGEWGVKESDELFLGVEGFWRNGRMEKVSGSNVALDSANL
ncbi:glucose-6-phosphate dehydrogenase [Pontiella agarivorans]|uniref:Glucose-6-phosphate 1-dehydrogenase n=1 Tax=Pontiella agarivorans TaxID=3038953 RepID=A0ABU5MUS3_9BACT|nr:glucose-6-phosphate dehydrogenase [Pontiella agarivorans]MDZ8117907.1 glucose-6-phosphate dehydrogenase [Pontiella agarivorans]